MFRWGFEFADLALDANGDGGGEGNPQGGANPTASFQRLLERHNQDALAMAQRLFDENYQYRERIRTLEAQAPAQGSVVLSAEEAGRWAQYQQLGSVETVQQGLQQRDQFQGELAGLRRAETLRSVAEVAGYKPGVLGNLDRMAKAEGKDLAFEVREVDGKRVAYVKDGTTETTLTDYANQQWADFLPALQQAPAQGSQSAAQQPGTRFPAQNPGTQGSQPSGSLVDKFVKEQQEKAGQKKNPLLKES